MAENVRIYLRIRPSHLEESTTNNSISSSTCLQADHQSVTLFNGPKAEVFTYDCVGGPETEQEEIFESVAKPVTEYCLQGYNGTIFAYGQTGSGKTFTMQGPMTEDGLIDFNQRGLIPRTFEYLFECIRGEEESDSNGAGREFLCKCLYVEIYNETIFDLLDMSGTLGTCNLREDIKRGVYIEGAKEEIITSPSEAYEVYERGSLNRHVAETSMNRESSRSHSVFTLFIQSKQRVGEIIDVRESRFNLVDLAGSERQQMTGTTGQRLKEAGNINKSLLALSNVINGLVEISNGRARHVQYRDSKLTFLLRDSLGGNAKTAIIANVSPSSLFYNETLSTLKFAQRAKMIKNKAVVNKDIQGNVLQLQAEIQRLQHELYVSRHGGMENSCDVKKPRLLTLVKEEDDLDPAEAYLMLTMALERQAESSDEIESFKSKVQLLEELVKRKESQNQSLRMILKFRENSLKSSPHPDSNEQVIDLKGEINELRKIIEHHPEVTRFAYENLQLREKLYKFEGNERKLEEFEAIINRHKQYEQLLTNRILVLEKTKEHNDEANESVDSISMQVISTSSKDSDQDETIKLLEKDLEIEKENRLELGNEIEVLNERIKEMDMKIEELKDEIVLKEQGLNTMNHEVNNYKQELNIMKQEITVSQRELIVKSQELQVATNKLQVISNELLIANEQLSSVTNELQSVKGGKMEIAGILEIERESLKKLIEERDELKGECEKLQGQFEREREQSRNLLQDFEKAKAEFNERLMENNLQLEDKQKEIHEIGQRMKTLQSEKGFLKEELEVTRQVLAEYKHTATSDEIITTTSSQRIGELEGEIFSLNEKLNELSSVSTSLTDRNKILQSENGQLHGKIGKLEFLMRNVQSDNDELMSKVSQLQKHLENSLKGSSTSSPGETNDSSLLANQLDVANHTITSLKRQLSQLEMDFSALRDENDKLTKHQNLKQKLHYHLKIKQENNELQEELSKCRDELSIIKSKYEIVSNLFNDIKNSKGIGIDKIINMIKSLSL